MARQLFLALLWASALALGSAEEPAPELPPTPPTKNDAVCRAQRRSVMALNAVCSVPTMKRSPGNFPWTHKPFCLRAGKAGAFCTYTNADFRSGRGLSVITDSDGAWDMATGSAAGLAELQDVKAGPEEPLVEEASKEGKGMGVFVRADAGGIKAGRTVMVDYPAVAVNREALEDMTAADIEELQWLAVMQLPTETRRMVRGLARSRGGRMDEIADVMKTNSLGQSFGEKRHVSIFPKVARVNHDCRPNAYYRFNETTMALTVFALRDLAPGEEVTFAYLDTALDAPRHIRQALLKEHWNFDCACSLCSAPAEEVALSDDRRNLIVGAKEKIRHSNGRARTLYRGATQLAHLYEEEGLIAPRARANEIAAFASSMMGDENEVRRFANAAKRYWRILAGKDSFEVKRVDELRRDPMGHPSWKAEMKAKDAPAGGPQQEAKEEEDDDEMPDPGMVGLRIED